MRYFVKTPWWLKKIYPSYIWDIKTTEKTIYLSFDDGPHPQVTDFVLEQLKKFNAKATFFCIGKNVAENPDVFKRIIEDGHAVGNHTYNHLNGFKTNDEVYLNDISEAAKLISSELFRPPYGRITSFQAKSLKKVLGNEDARIIMWDILSGDFDQNMTADKIIRKAMKHAKAGSIIVFHDSEKAFPHLKIILPQILALLQEKGFCFESLEKIAGDNKEN